MKRWRLLLADDHDIVIEGLRRILERPEFEIVGVVNDGLSLLRAAEAFQPDVIIADITMPFLNGIDAAEQIHKSNPLVKIVFLTMHPDVTFASEALAAGGSGYVLKSSAGDELRTAIREAVKGRTYVTQSIAEAVKQGLSSRSNAWKNPLDKMTPRQTFVVRRLKLSNDASGLSANRKRQQVNCISHASSCSDAGPSTRIRSTALTSKR